MDGALAGLLAIVAASAEQGTWERLKACPRDCCLWAFYDKSKNRSRRWCSMESCGNVEKARAFRERRRSERQRPAARAGPTTLSQTRAHSDRVDLEQVRARRRVPAGRPAVMPILSPGAGHPGVDRRPGAGVDQAERVHRLLVQHRVDAPEQPAAAHHVEAR